MFKNDGVQSRLRIKRQELFLADPEKLPDRKADIFFIVRINQI